MEKKATSILTTVDRLIAEHRRLSYYGAGAAVSKQLMEIGDNLCRDLTAAFSLNQLSGDSERTGYVPTIRADQGPAYEALANLYDYCNECRGIAIRCHRGPKV